MGSKQLNTKTLLDTSSIDRAVLGAGCFWCIEATLQRLKGVHKVESGYAGGLVKNPTYESVCTGSSGHAEVVRVEFDPKIINYQSNCVPIQPSCTSSCIFMTPPL
jgi:peptide methionine sulfoxide reductase MsrA